MKLLSFRIGILCAIVLVYRRSLALPPHNLIALAAKRE